MYDVWMLDDMMNDEWCMKEDVITWCKVDRWLMDGCMNDVWYDRWMIEDDIVWWMNE